MDVQHPRPPWRDCSVAQYRSMYPELPESSAFRLLKLLPGSRESALHCELVIAVRPKYPPFHAISYAWGSREFDHPISLHGAPFWTTAALHGAMKRVRNRWSSKFIWIDALCINQADVSERSEQVQQMKDIFGSAEKVLVYLGIHDNNSKRLPSLMKRVIGVYNDFKWTTNMNYPELEKLEKCAKDLPNATDDIWKTWQNTLCQLWWRRVWIIQEAVVARDLLFLIGDTEVRFGIFLQAYDAGLLCNLPVFQSDRHTTDKRDRVLHAGDVLHAIDQRRATSKREESSNLPGLLNSFRSLEASDPRDHCFALVGIAGGLRTPRLDPNYALDHQEIFTRYATQMVLDGFGPEVLQSNFSPVLDGKRPSWVPDWASNDFEHALLCYQYIRQKRFDRINDLESKRLQLLGEFFARASCKPEELEKIYLRGAYVAQNMRLFKSELDEITLETGATGPINIAQIAPSPPYQDLRQILKSKLSSLKSSPDFLEALCIVIFCVNLTAYLIPEETLRPSPKKLDHILTCADYESHLVPQRLPDRLCQFENLIPRTTSKLSKSSSRTNQLQAAEPLIASEQPGLSLYDCISLEDCVSQAAGYLSSGEIDVNNHGPGILLAADFCKRKRLALSDSGVLCQVCTSAKIGDSIYYPFGVNIPLLFRQIPNRKGFFQMVGEAYVAVPQPSWRTGTSSRLWIV